MSKDKLSEEQLEQWRAVGRDLGRALKALVEGMETAITEFNEALQKPDIEKLHSALQKQGEETESDSSK